MVCRYEQVANYHRLRTESRSVIEHHTSAPSTSRMLTIEPESISLLEPHCSEFLIHAADVEGLQRGIDHELVSKLSTWCTIPVTYAGGGRSIEDLELVKKLSQGKVDLTIGSALDIFGGSGVKFEDCVNWNQQQGH